MLRHLANAPAPSAGLGKLSDLDLGPAGRW